MSQRATILGAIASGLHRTREIAEHTGIWRHVVQIRIAELVRQGAICAFATCPHGNVGRPETYYRISGNPQALRPTRRRGVNGHKAAILRTLREVEIASCRHIEAITGISRNSASLAMRRLAASGKLRRVGVDMSPSDGIKPYLYELTEAA